MINAIRQKCYLGGFYFLGGWGFYSGPAGEPTLMITTQGSRAEYYTKSSYGENS